eukprot:scaffold4736_cov434-Prasinococcus_capsulatus_cf.AAC.1
MQWFFHAVLGRFCADSSCKTERCGKEGFQRLCGSPGPGPRSPRAPLMTLDFPPESGTVASRGGAAGGGGGATPTMAAIRFLPDIVTPALVREASPFVLPALHQEIENSAIRGVSAVNVVPRLPISAWRCLPWSESDTRVHT